MDYGRLMGRAWDLMWHHRFLWILGILAGGGVGSCNVSGSGSSYNVSSGDAPWMSPAVQRALTDIGAWLTANIGLVVALSIIAAIIGLVVWIISFIFQGGITSATIDLALGRRSWFGHAWGEGLRFFWRFFAIFWLLLLLWLIVFAILAIPFVLFALGGGAGALCFGIVWAILIGLIALFVLIVVSIIIGYAYRAIVANNVGVFEGLRQGYGVFRRNLGTSAVAWLLSVILSIGAGIAVLIIVGVIGVVFFLIGLALWSSIGFSAGLFVYAGIVLLILSIIGLIVGGIVNAYFQSYWTLVYLRLTGHLTQVLEPVPPSEPEGTPPPEEQ